MTTPTSQLAAWTSEFGQKYTDRNLLSPGDMDQSWETRCGVRKSAIFRQFLSPERLPGGRVLEVGSNAGLSLQLLRMANPALELYGVEPGPYALAKARSLDTSISYLPGNMFELPFRDGYFDVVMTNGVLIHIAPADLPKGLAEIVRCSKRFVFLCEYYSEQPQEVPYRGNTGLLWKMNYAREYLRHFPSLRVVQERLIRYQNPDGPGELVDQACLLEK